MRSSPPAAPANPISSERLFGLGCMALSNPELDSARAEATLISALESGVGLLDTADVYGPSAAELGHNEKLIARVLRDTGMTPRIVSKGGLERKGKQWRCDGRAKHLITAAEASLQRLGGEALDIYLLHAPDPAVAIETSARALARLHKQGKVREVGLSNVTVEQLERARTVAPVSWVEVELGPLGKIGAEGGVAERARTLGIRVLAHRPFGGAAGLRRLAKNPRLRSLAEDHGVGVGEVVLAWIYALDPELVALPGASRVDTAARAVPRITLSAAELAALDAEFPHGRMVRVPMAERRPKSPRGDVVVVMGIPGAGKTTCADRLESDGYLRLNRDERGGTLAGLIGPLETALAGDQRKVVLDNTYPARASRARVVEAAWRNGALARCVWLETSLEQAQVNVVRRMLSRHGRLLEEDEVKRLGDDEPNTFLPRVQYAFRERFEAPTLDEGFETVERIPFEARSWEGRPALLVDVEQHLLDAELRVRNTLIDRLPPLAERFFVAGIAWRPPGTGTAAELAAALEKLRGALGFPLVVEVCPHPPGPPKCWCRRPLPGLGLLLEHRHQLDLSRSYLVGQGAANAGFASRLGMKTIEVEGLTPELEPRPR